MIYEALVKKYLILWFSDFRDVRGPYSVNGYGPFSTLRSENFSKVKFRYRTLQNRLVLRYPIFEP